MHETLAAMAQALFESWFVDFDPVRAKTEGRDPGLPVTMADLFPDRLTNSELGEIPDGWPEWLRYIYLSNTKWGRTDSIVSYERDLAPSRAQRILRIGDTIVGTARLGNGSYALISEDDLTGSTGFCVLRPRRREYTEFVYLSATASENIRALSHLADGAAYPAVRPEVVAGTPAVWASDQLMRCFLGAVRPLLERMAANAKEERVLGALRDVLLPKLLSENSALDEAVA
jgi:type I restriction enzyme, S subunit